MDGMQILRFLRKAVILMSARKTGLLVKWQEEGHKTVHQTFFDVNQTVGEFRQYLIDANRIFEPDAHEYVTVYGREDEEYVEVDYDAVLNDYWSSDAVFFFGSEEGGWSDVSGTLSVINNS